MSLDNMYAIQMELNVLIHRFWNFGIGMLIIWLRYEENLHWRSLAVRPIEVNLPGQHRNPNSSNDEFGQYMRNHIYIKQYQYRYIEFRNQENFVWAWKCFSVLNSALILSRYVTWKVANKLHSSNWLKVSQKSNLLKNQIFSKIKSSQNKMFSSIGKTISKIHWEQGAQCRKVACDIRILAWADFFNCLGPPAFLSPDAQWWLGATYTDTEVNFEKKHVHKGCKEILKEIKPSILMGLHEHSSTGSHWPKLYLQKFAHSYRVQKRPMSHVT